MVIDAQRRRPRSTSTRRMSDTRTAEVLSVALDELVRAGYEALTMDQVAAAAHTSKATLYRQWHNKAGLVVAALARGCPALPRRVSTGSLREDLLALAAGAVPMSEEQVRLFAALSHVVRADPSFGALVRDALIAPNLAAIEAILADAVERGEVDAANPALAMVPKLLVAIGIGHPLVDGNPLERRFFEQLVDRVVLPILATSGRAPDR